MVQILPAGSLNLAALQVDDAYIQLVAPPNFITGVPTDVIGIIGTASWGPIGTPQLLNNGQTAQQTFGPMSSASLTDPFDLATDLYLAFGQASSQASLQGWASRVSDGTDVAASTTISAANSAVPQVCTITGTLTVGDGLQLIATSTAITGSPVTVTYICKAADTTSTMATGLAAAVNANAALAAVGAYAVALTNTVTLYWASTVSPTIVWTRAVTGTATEILTLTTGSAAAGGITITALYTGVGGNAVSVKIAASAALNSYDVLIVPPYGNLAETYRAIPVANFWRNLATYINNGQSSVRGASFTVKATALNPGVGAPTIGTAVLTGGTDGRSGVTTAIMLGSATASPPTGIWALANLNPSVGIAWMTGLSDYVNASATLLSFNLLAGCSSLIALPTGLTASAAVAAAQSAAVADPSFIYTKDWIYFFDTVNNQQRLVPENAVVGGTWAKLTPEQSPGNKPVQLVIGTERNNPQTGNLPYTQSDLALLEGSGIFTVTNPIPGGQVFGNRHGQTSSLQTVTAPAEYWRMTMYLARSAAHFLGQYVDQLQSQQNNDPLRQMVKLQSNNFLAILEGFGQIDNFLVTCTLNTAPGAAAGLGVNTPQSIAQHYLFVLWQVTYLSSVRFFVLSLQGGTTVIEVASQLTQQTATLGGV